MTTPKPFDQVLQSNSEAKATVEPVWNGHFQKDKKWFSGLIIT